MALCNLDLELEKQLRNMNEMRYLKSSNKSLLSQANNHERGRLARERTYKQLPFLPPQHPAVMSDKKSPPLPHCWMLSRKPHGETGITPWPSTNKASPSPVPLHLNTREKKERKKKHPWPGIGWDLVRSQSSQPSFHPSKPPWAMEAKQRIWAAILTGSKPSPSSPSPLTEGCHRKPDQREGKIRPGAPYITPLQSTRKLTT